MAVLVPALLLAGCAPGAPKGSDKATLDEAVSRAIGDPNTCVLIAERDSGRTVYRYNTATTCDREWPACDTAGSRKLKDLLERAVADGQARNLSCNTTPDGSRGVSWAAGPIAGAQGEKPLVYAAVMEGNRVFPGLMMADRLSRAWTRAGLSPEQP
ncbi:hypothetical protein [Phenylobacterium sp. J367]|uniref:hypothetical protein n=1 Tax=Phenylobacterium sp. J367 TaxID=2898435 RepID=UPI002151C37D|nr:hypothetical protein [Phenylobacterium sp. J367]MCR5881159.1 hypothetical protein [Phenylobacterium sp. J367]